MIFFGSGAFGLPTLKRLAAHENILGVVTQPDRPAGRGGIAAATPIGAWAAENLPDIPLLKPERVGDAEMVRRIRELAGAGAARACFVVIAFGQKMPRELLEGVFAINLHASLLPRWRGAAPINAAVLAGDPITGNSVITLADRMDAGLVLGQSCRPIPPEMTAGELHDLLAEDGASLVERVLGEWRSGSLKPIVQDESLVTRAGKLSKADGWVNFHDGAEACRRRVHGLTPWPGVAVQFREESMKLLRVACEAERGGDARPERLPGTIIDAANGIVACAGAQDLRLLEVQPAGRKGMGWSDFANGRRVVAGEVLHGRGDGC